jgi:copper resistance protein B
MSMTLGKPFAETLLLCLLMTTTMTANAADMTDMNMSAMQGMDMSHMSMGDMQSMHPIKKPTTKKKPWVHKSAPIENKQHVDHQMPMSDMKSMRPDQMPKTDQKNAPPNPAPTAAMQDMDHGQMQMDDMKDMPMSDMKGMSMSNMSMPAQTSTGLRSPDYSQGRDNGGMQPHMMGNGVLYGVMLNQAEVFSFSQQTGYVLNLQSWVGTDDNRAVLGLDAANSKLTSHRLSADLTWQRPLSPFWNTNLGAQFDHEDGNPNQAWLLANINGITPYWLNLSGSILVGKDGQIGLVLDGFYDLRITQRLVLQPSVETKLYSRDQASDEIGSGLSEIKTGLRLRYELTRTFAPYLGIEETRYLGNTASYYKARDGVSRETIVSAGVSAWF